MKLILFQNWVSVERIINAKNEEKLWKKEIYQMKKIKLTTKPQKLLFLSSLSPLGTVGIKTR